MAEAFEIGATSGPPRSSSAPRHGDGVLDADLSAGLDEALAHGFALENADGVFLRHELVGRAVEADLLPSARSGTTLPLPPLSRTGPSWPCITTRSRSMQRRLAMLPSPQPISPHPSTRPPTNWLRSSWPSRRRAPHPRLDGRAARGAGTARAADQLPARGPIDLAIRAAEAAFAADRPVRAAAYLDATIGAADARRDRTRLGLIYDRLGQFRRVAGDAEGAVAARRRAVELVPTTPSPARAGVVAGLAQLRMLEGTFSVAEKLARDAIRIARACDPPAPLWSCMPPRPSGCRSVGGPTPTPRWRC